jgi:serine/threonine protein kinase
VVSGISAGSYVVKIARNGYYDYTRIANVAAGKTTTVSATLTYLPQAPVTGSLDVRSTPSGASVYIDDTYKGITPTVVSGISAGSYVVKIARNGYYDYTKATTVTAGKTTTVSATLTVVPQTPVTGSLDISSTPSGANIYIDGEYKGVTPEVISGLSEGECWVTVIKDGYVEDNQHKYISAGSTSRVLATLSPIVTSPTEPLLTVIPSGSFPDEGLFTMLWWLLAAAIVLPAGGFIYARKRRSARTGGSEVDETQSSGSPVGHDDGQRRKTATEKVIDAVVVIASFLTCLILFEMLNQFLGLYLQLPIIAVLTAVVFSMGYFIYSRRNRQNPQDRGSETGGSRSPDLPAGYGTEQASHPDATTPPGKAGVSVQKSSSLSPKKPNPSIILPDGGSIASTAKPDLAITLSHTSIHADEWDKIGLTLVNIGTAPAFDITLKFSNDIDTRLLRPVDLAVGANITIDAGIKPRTKGKIPLEITAQYHDTENRNYEQTTSFWLSVEPRSGSVPPGSPVPSSISRPVTPRSLPSEMAERYTASEFIGKGGFARVFKVQKPDGSWTALKIPISLDAATGKSFIAELQNWTSLVHENIVRVDDYNIMPIPYFELELCDGTLATLERPVPPDHVAWLLFNVCEGLKYAHTRGILHRDLKPQNIMLRDGVPKISDWGLSKVMTQSRTTTVSGGFTAYYAAPEQITNKPKDERTDIWQLGVILYELVTGQLPFTGESMVEIGMAIATKTPERPGAVHPDAQPLDTIILKCLEKDSEQRYQSAADLQKDLAAYLKMNYVGSLKESIQANDLQRSAYYCGDLVLISMKIGDLVAAYKYATNLARYSAGEIQAQATELAAQIKMRVEMGVRELPDELVRKAEVIVHQVRVR